LGPAKPRGVTWKGAGGWVIVSQARHENFSRTVWMMFALERQHSLRPSSGLLGRHFIFDCCHFKLFKLKLYLLQKPRLALRALTVNLAAQLLDRELEMRD
jgi:hypothetical protein